MSTGGGLIHRTVGARVGQPPHPALLLLHGRGSHELDLLGLAPELDKRFFVVSARAPHAWMGGYRWYDGDGADPQASLQESIERLDNFVRSLGEAYPIDAWKLYLLGFSQGSLMSNALLLTAPELVAG